MKPDDNVDLNGLARQYELTGTHIMNIVQFACLQALSRDEKQIRNGDILEGIRKEYIKEGKLV
jgi:ATP-dependent 26S proteasome regulatory subunit